MNASSRVRPHLVIARPAPATRIARVKTSWWTKPRAGAGWLAMGGMAAALAVTSWPLAVAIGGGWVALAMRGHGRSRRAMAHLEAAFPDAERVHPHTAYDELNGELAGQPFVVRNSVDTHTLHIFVGTPLPPGLSIVEGRGALGDAAFDARFRVAADEAEDELAGRMVLTAAHRATFCALFAGVPVKLDDGWFDILVQDDDADGPTIERWVREGCALGIAMWKQLDVEERFAAFRERIPREPVTAVRRNHYAWLVARGHEVPAVLHLAARDPADEIRAWAQSQRPVETLYR